MVDFARWERAVAVALDRTPEAFDAAYTNSQRSQVNLLAEHDPVALAVIKYLDDKAMPYETTADELYPRLDAIAKQYDLFGLRWPGGKSAMGSRLDGLTQLLGTLGIKITRLPRINSVRSRWRFDKGDDAVVSS